MSPLEAAFIGLISLQCLVIAAHDWIDVPGWLHGHQIQTVIGKRKLAIATLINVTFPGTAVVFAIKYFNTPKPAYVLNYWVTYTAITIASAFAMWWIPYFFGCSAERSEEYRKMYSGTRCVLPPRNGDPGPNTTHLFFHGLFLATLVLALILRFKAS